MASGSGMFAGLSMATSPGEKKSEVVEDNGHSSPTLLVEETLEEKKYVGHSTPLPAENSPETPKIQATTTSEPEGSSSPQANLSSDQSRPEDEQTQKEPVWGDEDERLSTVTNGDKGEVKQQGTNLEEGKHSQLSVLRKFVDLGPGVIDPDTPIPNADIALKLLRKFISKSRHMIPTSCGGSRKPSMIGYLFGASKEIPPMQMVYKHIVDVLAEDKEQDSEETESSAVVESIMGHSGDTMSVARSTVAAFCTLLLTWCEASLTAQADDKYIDFPFLMVLALDTAQSLVAHACLDSVLIGVGNKEYSKVVDVLAEGIFVLDSADETIELSALKFLLNTGCRSTPENDAMLRGTYILRTIRVFYHVYLNTTCEANKTTAKAALQQLVTNVFKRMQRAPDPSKEYEHFPSENHRDGFLVLRSLCKLSMRNSRKSHNNGVKNADEVMNGMPAKEGSSANESVQPSTEQLPPLSTTASDEDPALESEIVALELLLYIFQNTDMTGSFSQNSGEQFHYALRNYLCVSLLKNCTSHDTTVINLSLRLFVPLIRNFRSHLKTEIEAFVTNVFFVILDSKNSTVGHKILVVTLFEEICSDPATLAEIFLNYDCDLSAVDLFHRIVNSLSKVAKTEAQDTNPGGFALLSGVGATGPRMEKVRQDDRVLRLYAMRALRQILISLHGSIAIVDVSPTDSVSSTVGAATTLVEEKGDLSESPMKSAGITLVEMYDSKKKRREKESEVALRFNQKPSAGINYAAKCLILDGDDPVDVARYLLRNKDVLDKTQIGEYLGREVQYQNGFSIRVLHAYANLKDLAGLPFDDAIRYYLSGFRLPGEAQKIDRIMEKFAERYTLQNPNVFPTADIAFILAFSIIMLNTDLHNPSIKEERRMTKEGFIRNNRGISDGQDLPDQLLISIFDRIKKDPISLKEDDEARQRVNNGSASKSSVGAYVPSVPAVLTPAVFFGRHYDEIDKKRETHFQKERAQIVRTTESLFRRNRQGTPRNEQGNPHLRLPSSVNFARTEDTGLCDAYVSPMFEVTWGPALAVFSTAMEYASKSLESLSTIAGENEMKQATENVAETIEVCLTGFRFAICTAGLCGNDTARNAFMLALTYFSQLGSGYLLEPRHVRCVQTLLKLGSDSGELLGDTWEHVFKAVCEVNRLHEIFQSIAKNNKVLEGIEGDIAPQGYAAKGGEIDRANSLVIYDAIPESLVDAIYHRSSSLSGPSVKSFVLQLCRVSDMQISSDGEQGEPNIIDSSIHSLQKLVEFTHYNMDSRPRLIFDEIWTIVAGHLTSAALHSNVAVATFAIDSFRQLSTQYLKHEEPEGFEFQQRFLKPLETVMACSEHVSVKELLLKCIERIIFMFGFKLLDNVAGSSPSNLPEDNTKKPNSGTLRSGWRPILAILGLCGSDDDDGIAQMGIKMLSRQLRHCISEQTDSFTTLQKAEDTDPVLSTQSSLFLERFVDIVNALFVYISGPREEISIVCIDHLVTLSNILADKKIPITFSESTGAITGETSAKGVDQQLELWWPILFGLSRSVGDARTQVRQKSLITLLGIIDQHFSPLTPSEGAAIADEDATIQTLQLIFRGVLMPMLEHAETDVHVAPALSLPIDFERFITEVPSKDNSEDASSVVDLSWVSAIFEQLMDGCVSICLRTIEVHKVDAIVVEILAMLNSCLQSECNILAVRGLHRLHQFITKDLEIGMLANNTWATVCHMLRRCLSVEGSQHDAIEDRREISNHSNGQDQLSGDRTYVVSNAIMISGSILTYGNFAATSGLQWRIFLATELAEKIKAWEQEPISVTSIIPRKSLPEPHKVENAIYGRRWMNQLLLKMVTGMPAEKEASVCDDAGNNHYETSHNLVKEQTQSLVSAFLEHDVALKGGDQTKVRGKALQDHLAMLLSELLTGYEAMENTLLFEFVWLPSILNACIQCGNESIRLAVNNISGRMIEDPPSATTTNESIEDPSSATTTNESASDALVSVADV